MAYKVIWAEAAIADLREICGYIGRHDPDAARKMGYGLLEHVRVLESFLLIGPHHPRGARGPLREILFRNYRIFYDVSETARTVMIIHVRHGARQEPEF